MSRCGKKLTATLPKFESGSLADKLWGGRPRPRRTPWSGSANPRKRPTWASAADQGVRPTLPSYTIGCRSARIRATLGLLRIHHGDGCYVDNLVYLRAALEHMHGLRESIQNRSDGLGAAQSREQLVGDVAGFEIREDQDIGAASEWTECIIMLDNFRRNRGVGLHLAIHH